VWHCRYCNVSGQNKGLPIECCFQERYINAIIIIVFMQGKEREKALYCQYDLYGERIQLKQCETYIVKRMGLKTEPWGTPVDENKIKEDFEQKSSWA